MQLAVFKKKKKKATMRTEGRIPRAHINPSTCICNPGVKRGELEPLGALRPAILVYTVANRQGTLFPNKAEGKDQHPRLFSDIYTGSLACVHNISYTRTCTHAPKPTD